MPVTRSATSSSPVPPPPSWPIRPRVSGDGPASPPGTSGSPPTQPTERRAAGDYPNQNPGGDGLPRWTAADRALVATDLVLWHTFGVTHIVRPEDWPVMPVERTGFSFVPSGFFDGNPALDLPPGPG